jgi:hypothetical protein
MFATHGGPAQLLQCCQCTVVIMAVTQLRPVAKVDPIFFTAAPRKKVQAGAQHATHLHGDARLIAAGDAARGPGRTVRCNSRLRARTVPRWPGAAGTESHLRGLSVRVL